VSDALREAILRALAEDGGPDAASGGEVARAVLDVAAVSACSGVRPESTSSSSSR